MKFKKRIKAFQAQQDKSKAPVVTKQNSKKSELDVLAEYGPFYLLKEKQSLQEQLYDKGDLAEIECFFQHGGCFGQSVQKLIIKHENFQVFELFLKYWELMETERSRMLREASLNFIELYLNYRSLGKKWGEFAKAGRLPKEFRRKWLSKYNRPEIVS